MNSALNSVDAIFRGAFTSVRGRAVSEHPIVDVGPLAHGGHCVGRLDGQVVFVRHALPGERVRIRITERNKTFLRADAVEVLHASDGRVEPACAYAGRCGGCDFQHVHSAYQRELLGGVLAEQLRRIAGIEMQVHVEAVQPEDLGWRTRMTYVTGDDGRLGMRAHRSHEVIPIDDCPIASPDLPDVLSDRWPSGTVTAVASSTGQQVVATDTGVSALPGVDGPGVDGIVTPDGQAVEGDATVRERVHDLDFHLTATTFWQTHPRAAETLVDAVREALNPRPGERIADLYAGAGLFSAFLARDIGNEGLLYSVEADRTASSDARTNLAEFDHVRVENCRVERGLGSGICGTHVDGVVLDPPRTGAKAAIAPITKLEPERIVYVACDPAALARDVASLTQRSYRLEHVRGFALFPMTHHVECVAVLRRAL